MLELKSFQRLHIGPIDLTIETGECICLTGESGSGKSLLLRAIADLDRYKGEVSLDGIACSDTPGPRWRRLVTYVAPQSGWWAKDVYSHFGPDADVSTLLESVGLQPEVAKWPVEKLSTGERQRLALLRALGPLNRVLLLDEPTSGLDRSSIAKVETLLRAQMAKGTSIILVSHNEDQAKRIASRHFELHDGQIRELV